MATPTTKAQVELELKLGKALAAMTELIEVIDKVNDGLGKMGKTGGKALSGIQKQLDKLNKKFPKIAVAITGMNQAFQLFSSVASIAIGAVSKAFTSFTNFVKAGIEDIRAIRPFDPLILAMDQAADKARTMRAKISRPFLAAFVAVNQAVQPVMKELSKLFQSDAAEGFADAMANAFKDLVVVLGRQIIPLIRLFLPLADSIQAKIGDLSLGPLNKKISAAEKKIKSYTHSWETFGHVNVGTHQVLKKSSELTAKDIAMIGKLTPILAKLQEQKKRALEAKVGTGLEETLTPLIDAIEKRLNPALDKLGKKQLKTGNEIKNIINPAKQLRKVYDEASGGLEEFFAKLKSKSPAAAATTIKTLEAALAHVNLELTLSKQDASLAAGAFKELEKVGVSVDMTKLLAGLTMSGDKMEQMSLLSSLLTGKMGELRAILESGYDGGDGMNLIAVQMKVFQDQVGAAEAKAMELDAALIKLGKVGLKLEIELDDIKDLTPLQQVEFYAKKLDEAEQAQASLNDQMNAAVGFASAAAGAFGQYIGAIMEGGAAAKDALKELGKAMVMAFIDAISMIIMADAARAATGAASQIFGSVPMPWALPIAAAAAGAAMAFVKGFASMLMAEEGGYVTGGIRNKDSVPVMTMPGEYIMSVPQVEGVKKFMGNMGATIQRPAGASGGRGGGPININVSTNQLPDRMATKRWLKTTIIPAMNELQRVGY